MKNLHKNICCIILTCALIGSISSTASAKTLNLKDNCNVSKIMTSNLGVYGNSTSALIGSISSTTTAQTLDLKDNGNVSKIMTNDPGAGGCSPAGSKITYFANGGHMWAYKYSDHYEFKFDEKGLEVVSSVFKASGATYGAGICIAKACGAAISWPVVTAIGAAFAAALAWMEVSVKVTGTASFYVWTRLYVF